MNNIGIDTVLQQIRALANEASAEPSKASDAQSQVDFSTLLKQSIDKVNEIQSQAGQLSKAFERGDPQVSLAQVMVADQKAGLAFQALTHVRNHVLSAYKEIMNMQV